MKPIGSITKDFPFLEPEERELILSIVGESRNYNDFAVKLQEYVMSNQASELMIHLALSHIANTLNFNEFEKIQARFPQHPSTLLNYTSMQMLNNGIHDWQVLLKEVDGLIATTTNPLLLFDLYSEKWTYVRSSSIGTLEEDRIIQSMTDLIQQHPSLESSRALVSKALADRYATDSQDLQKALEEYESALKYSSKFDDVVFNSNVQVSMAKCLSLTDPTRALGIIEQAAKTKQELGNLDRSFGTYGVMGVIFDARGEYNAAVKSYEQTLSIREELHRILSLGLWPTALSRSFRRMGNYEESLEWARIALTSTPMQSRRVQSLGIQVLGNLGISAALAQLGRIDEAQSYLDIGNELALKAGIEVWLSDVSFCRGLIARAEGKLPEAIEYFLNTFEVLERLQRQGRLNECLFVLAETEIQHYMESPDADATLALHWISVMEEMARTKDLPGVLGLALLLKTRMHTIRGQEETAYATLNQVRDLSENPSTLFLKDRIEIESSATPPRRRK